MQSIGTFIRTPTDGARSIAGAALVACFLAWSFFSQPTSAQTADSALARYLRPRCLTPEAGRILQELGDSGSLQSVLPVGFSIVGGAIRPHEIALVIVDRQAARHHLTMALPGSTAADRQLGTGRRFSFQAKTEPPAAEPSLDTVLLALAVQIDEAIPESALEYCARSDAIRTDRRFPLSWILVAAAAQILALGAATAYGLRLVRRDGRTDGGRQGKRDDKRDDKPDSEPDGKHNDGHGNDPSTR